MTFFFTISDNISSTFSLAIFNSLILFKSCSALHPPKWFCIKSALESTIISKSHLTFDSVTFCTIIGLFNCLDILLRMFMLLSEIITWFIQWGISYLFGGKKQKDLFLNSFSKYFSSLDTYFILVSSFHLLSKLNKSCVFSRHWSNDKFPTFSIYWKSFSPFEKLINEKE